MRANLVILWLMLWWSDVKSVDVTDGEYEEVMGSAGDADDPTGRPRIGTKDEFRLLLTGRRREQRAALKTLESFGRYEQKYSMIDNIFGKVFEMQEKAKYVIENSDYVLGSDLPTDAHHLEALSHIIDNCAFFGDIVLRLPDLSHRVLSAHHEYQPLYKWCVSFAMASDLLDPNTQKMFDLMAQELSLVPKDDQYVNPYRKSSSKGVNKPDIDVVVNGNADRKDQKNAIKRNQKPVKKGPRLSKSRSEL